MLIRLMRGGYGPTSGSALRFAVSVTTKRCHSLTQFIPFSVNFVCDETAEHRISLYTCKTTSPRFCSERCLSFARLSTLTFWLLFFFIYSLVSEYFQFWTRQKIPRGIFLFHLYRFLKICHIKKSQLLGRFIKSITGLLLSCVSLC